MRCISYLLGVAVVLCFASACVGDLSLLGEPIGTVTRELESGCTVAGLGYELFEAYLGIPYAEPPVGDFRWEMPVPLPCSGQVVAQKVQPACPQPSESPLQGEWEDEDCLFLNVWRPAGNATGLPVMVYVHGGGWTTGAGSLALYFGQHIAAQDVILVTLNYRLGALGFLVTPDIPGNFGFVDQRTALEWVQDHIEGFGGDKSRVTLVGQSAGGISVSTHLTAPKSFGTFQQVINHSGPTVLTYRTQEETYPVGESFAEQLGCDVSDVSCMKAASWEDVLTAQGATQLDIESVPVPLYSFFNFMPVIDGDNILESPQAVINRNDIAPGVNVIWGSTRNETAGWVYLTAPNLPLLPIEYKAVLTLLFGERDGRKVFEQYPAEDSDDVRYQMSMLSVDYGFTCAMRHNAMATSSNTTTEQHTVRSYVFMHPPSSDPRATGTVSDCATIQEVCHGAELDYVFHTAILANASFTEEEQDLSFQMSDLWTSYMKGTLSEETWPTYTPDLDDILAIDYPSPYVIDGYRADYCEFWESLDGYTQPF